MAAYLTNPTAVTALATLKQFSQGGVHGFTFTRYWWDGQGQREGITPWIHKKLHPGHDPEFGTAAKSEILLPPSAPAVYAAFPSPIEHFDRQLPRHERNVMVQLKLALDPEEPWHYGYENIRAFARWHFAERFPVILAAHVPSVGGLNGYDPHVHCIALSRRLPSMASRALATAFCSDKGYLEALTAWKVWNAIE